MGSAQNQKFVDFQHGFKHIYLSIECWISLIMGIETLLMKLDDNTQIINE